LVVLAVGGLSLLAMVQILPLSEARAQGSGDLQVRKELSGGATTGTFQSGEEIVFTIAYRCAKVVGSCQAVTITDTFVSDLEFLGIDSLLPTASYGQNGQVVTVDLGDLPAGDTGIFQMRARFRLGTLPGTTVTNTVTMGSPNANPPTATSNQVSVTASGSFRMTVNKDVVNNAQTGVIGSQFQTTYQLNICNPNGGLGGVPLQNATITDTLPANAVPVLPVPNGGVYNAGPPRQVVWTGLTLPVTNGCYTLSLPVRFSGVTSGTLVNNRFQVSGKPADNPTTTTALGPTGHTLTLRDPYYAAALNKSAATASDHPDDPGVEELAGRPVTYTLTYNNLGTLPITNVVVTDDIPSQIVTITQVAVNPVTPTQLVTLAYELNDSGIFTVYGAYAASTSVNLSGLSRITGLRWELGQMPLDSGWSSDYTGISDSALNENDSFTNCATGVGFSDGSNRVTNACQTVEIISLRAIPRVEKRLNEPGQHLPEEVVSYTLRVYNDDVAHNNVLAPITLIDLLPEELEVVVFDSGAWRLATSTDSWYAYTGPAGAPSPVAVFTPTFTLDNETLLRWRWTAPYELPPGEELLVSFAVRIKRGTPPGNLDNVAIQLWDEPGTTNELYCVGGQVHTDTQDLDGDGNTAEQGCRSENEPTQVGVFLAMKSEKFVWGERDSGWNKDGWTVPGGNVDYRMVITNISNVTTTDIVVYDIFPFIGDTGVVDLSSRDSDWRPNLQQPISTPPGTPLTIQYSRSQNPCRPEVVPSGPPGCINDWSTSPPADLTSVQAIRLEFCDAGGCLDLGPDPGDGSGGRLEFSWNMQAPNDAPADPARAWNSFGFTAAGGGLQLLPAEPNKVGIRVQRYVTDTVNLGNYVWLDVYGQQNDGIQQPEESGINGVRVELLDEFGNPIDENGDGENDYRITGDDQFGNPGYYLFVGLPANMTYTVRFYPPLTYTLGPELPVTYNTSSANQGSDDGFDSDGVVSGSNTTGNYIETGLITTTLALTTDLRWDQGLWLPTDYGDAPNSYKTSVAGLIANSENPALAARHVILPGIYMGSRVDAELDGPISTGFGDDTDVNPDDEEGVTFEVYTGTLQTPTAVMIIGDTADLTVATTVPASYTGYLNAWIDFNRDGDFFDAGEQVANNRAAPNGGGNLNLAVAVPSTAISGTTYARFRFSTEQNLLPTGGARDGEVEDYPVILLPGDYGDLPNGYGTTKASNGARHPIWPTNNPTLGSVVDDELDGQPTTNADGDDNNDSDDEDGVSFNSELIPSEVMTVTVTAANVAGGYLNAWIDFTGDNDFNDPNERLATDRFIPAGVSVVLTTTVPANADQNDKAYARFRFSSRPSPNATGPALDGEVEDYAQPILPLDYGDLPNTYPTEFDDDGARHVIRTGGNPTLGARVDAELDGQDNNAADGDDNANSSILVHGSGSGDDENGVTFDTLWVPGKVATITVSSLITGSGGADGRLNAWIDFNSDSAFAPSEQIAANLNLSAGASRSISFTVPSTVSVGNLYSRFRFSTQSDLTPTGLALDGEVEDYRQLVVELDYGDLPDGYGTTDAAGGAYHVIDPALYLGSTVDDELDGQPNTSATGDDATGSDDEDGVIFEPLIAGRTSALTITAVSGGVLNGWIDWNANDQFDPGEQIFSDRALVNGSNSLSVTVPLTASLSDDIYMRFRYSSQSGLPPTGPAPDGEVEDYVTRITAYDFGDALNSYSTQLAQDGARHVLSPTIYLGSRIDIEDDGRSSANAQGDDSQTGPGLPTDGDDEDGVEFSILEIGRTATLTVTASTTGLLNAWLDFGDDGDWAAAIDQIFADRVLSAGQNILTFTVPETATVTGATFARFRLSSAGGLSYTGPAPDGEVEDYLVPLIGYDYGDLLDSFQTTALAGGPYHVISPTLYLGSRIDPEGDGQPSPDADGDDANPPGLDDEDGVSFDTPLIPGEVATITVQAVGSGNFSAWLDFNGNGRFDAGERVFTNTLLSPGSTALSFTVPATATPGSTGVRVRYSTANLTSPAGPAPDGEVEDYLIALNRLDFGDLPDDASSPAGYAAQTYPTGLSNNGARHVILAGNNPTLGSTVDAEGDGQPALEALGDDASGDPDDEDGVTFSRALVPGETSLITVTASGDAGLLSAWIDFNGDGDLNDAGEQIAADQSLAAGSSLSLTVNVPLTATRGITSYSRFRFSSQSGLAPTGLALDGEVEDYAIRIAVLDFGDLPNDLSNHPTLAANNGARHIINPAANPILGLAIDAEADGQPGPDADGDDSAGSPDDEDGVIVPPLIPGETITVTITYSNPTGVTAYLNGWLDTDGDGTLTQILTDEPVAPGASGVLQVPVFISGEPYGSTGYSRFRISTQPGPAVSGLAPDGEVEDYVQTIVGFDFGDLPDDASSPAGYAAQTYPTQLSDSGARHAIMPTNNPTLGATVDAEPDGQPALEADGDDANPIGLDDEDGVGFSGLLVPGEPFVITATVSVTGAYLNAWIDFNGDGDLDDAGEQIAVDRVMVVGDNVFTITVPLEAQQAITTYGRFRLSSDTGLTPTGLAYDGEVEDYGLPTQLLASLGDIVWLDEDGDGKQDGNEAGLENVTVVLWRDTTGNGTPDTPVMTRTTTITGYYRFDYLVPGVVYQVEFRPPAGYSFTVPDNTGDDLDSDANLITGRTPPVILTPGEHNDTLDAGLYRAGLAIDKAVSVAVAAPTQVVTYTLTVTNTGDVPLSSVRITDTLDAGLSYVSGSGSLTPTTVNGQQLVWVASGPGGQLAPNQSLVLTFRVQVPTSASTTLYQNRVAAVGTHPTGTTHPPVTDQVSVVVNDPSVALDKSLVAPGAVNGVVTFTIRITNTGPSVLDELPLFDTFNGPVEYIGGAPPADVIDNANRTLTWLDLTASFGRNLAPGETFEIVTVFQVLQDSARFSMQNTATVPGGVGGANDVLDNPTTEVSDSVLLDNVPTAIELKSFAAQRQGRDILVTWETAVEINNYAFRLMRSLSGDLTEAVEVALMPGQGAGVSSGASYSYLDQGVEAGRSYSYWLVDIDLEGGETVNGPVLVSPTQPTGGGEAPTYLPVIIK
jgi:uncharacterized repeat protein (TIGR01451 family)